MALAAISAPWLISRFEADLQHAALMFADDDSAWIEGLFEHA
jgi:hypothetical protein